MATVTESPTTTVRLQREHAAALLAEARREFENGAEELYGSNDEPQRPRIEACVEIIGRLAPVIERDRWPKRTVGPDGSQWLEDETFVQFEFSAGVMDWLAWDCEQHAVYVENIDDGSTGHGEPGYYAEQVFLLHVLRLILDQVEAV